MGLSGPVRIKRNRQIQATAYSIEPSTVSEVPNKPTSPPRLEIQSPRSVVGGERLGEGTVQLLDIPTILGRETTY